MGRPCEEKRSPCRQVGMERYATEEKRPLGRPRMQWRGNILEDLRTLGDERAEELMMDRSGWRQIVRSAKADRGL